MKIAEKVAIGYIRVSTNDQAENGASLDSQRARIQAWCERSGYRLMLFEEEAVSGSRTDRPQLAAAIKAACSGGTLVVVSLSRLGRSTRHVLELAERLKRAGAALVSLTEQIDTCGAAGTLFFQMLAVMAEFERNLVAERTSAALQHKRSKGERAGQIPYGAKLARDGVRLLPHLTEQKAIRRAQRLRTRGLSLRGIAAKLGKEGHKPRGGNAWHPQTVSNILEASNGY